MRVCVCESVCVCACVLSVCACGCVGVFVGEGALVGAGGGRVGSEVEVNATLMSQASAGDGLLCLFHARAQRAVAGCTQSTCHLFGHGQLVELRGWV